MTAEWLVLLWTPGGYPGFQVTRRCEWGQKLKPEKIPWAWSKTQKNSMDQNETPKNPCWILEPYKYPEGITGKIRTKIITKKYDNTFWMVMFVCLFIVLLHLVVILTNCPKITCQSFYSPPPPPPKKKSWISNEKNCSHLPVAWNVDYPCISPSPNWSFSHQLEFLTLSCSTCTLSFVVPLKPLIGSGQSIIYLVSCLLIYLSEFLFSN